MIRLIKVCSIVLFASLSYAQKDTSVILSEIMFYPTITNGEFIELYNASSVDTIDLKNWKIKYYTSNPDVISDAGFGTKLLPKQFAVIFEGDYSSGYNFPNECLRLKISDNSFGTSGMSNTESREIKLINASNDTLSNYFYSVPNLSGYSDEKKIMNNDNSSTNWANCLNLNGTPGKTNSVSPLKYDIGILYIYSNKNKIKIGDSVEIGCIIKNYGTELAENISVNFKYDLDNDSIYEISVFKIKLNKINPSDSVKISSSQIISNVQFNFNVFCEIEYSLDENINNNTLTKSFSINNDSINVIINEVMYAPQDGEPEWIELFNKSNKNINIKNWTIADLSTKTVISTKDFILPAQSYLVLADDNSLTEYYDTIPSKMIVMSVPSLNNDKDAIIICDENGVLVDSFYYTSTVGSTGKSIERYKENIATNELSNWFISIADSGATPGKENSVKNIQSANFNSIILNEIMYEPKSNLSEYLEFKNNSDQEINLIGWKVQINDNSKILINKNLKLNSNSYLVFTSDSSNIKYFNYLTEDSTITIFNLNKTDMGLTNSIGNIKIYDPLNKLIDSIQYSEKMHNPIVMNTKGRSLERLSSSISSNDFSNWSTCSNQLGGTPGIENSISFKSSYGSSTLDISPNPFSPDYDGYEDFAVFSYKLNFNSGYIKIKIFDSKGRLVKTFVDNEFSGSEGKFIYNGLDEENKPLRMGIYIALFEAYNKETGQSEKIKKAFVIARKL